MRNFYCATGILLVSLFFWESINANHPSISRDKILFKSGEVRTVQNFQELSKQMIPDSDIIDGRYYRIIQFNKIPAAGVQELMNDQGITLLNYLPFYAYIASIRTNANLDVLNAYDVRTMLRMEYFQKCSRAIRENNIPEHSRPVQGSVDLVLMYYHDLDHELIRNKLSTLGIELLKEFPGRKMYRIRVAESRVSAIADLPFVKFLEELEAPSEPDDTKGRSLHRANMISSDFASGLHYDGSGVSISLADDGEVGPHIDFHGRITQLISSGPGGSHGDMTAGIASGSGNLDPTKKGMAAGSHIYIHDVNDGVNPYDHIYNAVHYYDSLGAVITSTSYSQGCNSYNTIASTGDQIVHQNPQLNFVFSAGNRGQNDCGYGTNAAWGTITGGFKQGKNVVACGNLNQYDVLDATSSRGPSEDGRIKPDICANGRDQNTTRDNNRYQVGGGTSAACPGIAGISAQLIQAYRENIGPVAPSPLIKASMLNTADDLGNAGPDFTYGWGRVNAYRALNLLLDGRYILDSVSGGMSKQHNLIVPANVRKLRCMIYWLDREGDPAAAISLVNDLDMTLEDPSATSWQPWILDPTPVVANLTTPAIRGVDHLNNMEQVSLDNPAAGTYTVHVSGTLIPSGVQEYYLLWEFDTDEITLTYPNGGEGFVPGETEALRWDAVAGTETFNLDYSLDSGSNWINIVTGFAANLRQYDWNVPNTISDQVILRLTRGVNSDQSNSTLAIMNLPTNLMVDFVCTSVMQLSWSAAAGATAYEVSRLGSMYMDSIATSNLLSVQVAVPDSVSTWFSVRAIGPNGGKGRRAIAVQKMPGALNCGFANDLNLISVTNPQAGLLFPCQNLSTVPVAMEIRNEGINAAHGFSLSYSINGGAPVTETYPDTLLQGITDNYTFVTPADLSVLGTYQFDFSISYPADANLLNNTSVQTVDVMSPGVIPLVEDFESLTFPPVGWTVLASSPSMEWQVKTGIVGADGSLTKSAWFDNYSYNNAGARDYLGVILADFTGISHPMLTFDVAYANFNNNADALGVEISTDCGQTFIPTSYLKAGANLSSAGASTSDWEPVLSSHWRKDTLSLLAHANSQVLLRFVNVNAYGNNLYVDNINLESVINPGIDEKEKAVALSLYPNPAYGTFNLNVNNLASDELQIEVFDMNGRQVKFETYQNTTENFKTGIDLRGNPVGVYMLRVTNGEKSYVLRATMM